MRESKIRVHILVITCLYPDLQNKTKQKNDSATTTIVFRLQVILKVAFPRRREKQTLPSPTSSLAQTRAARVHSNSSLRGPALASHSSQMRRRCLNDVLNRGTYGSDLLSDASCTAKLFSYFNGFSSVLQGQRRRSEHV